MGIQTVRLYKNTTSTIPIGVFTDVSDQFDLGLGTIINETLTETLTVTGLTAGMQVWFWLQCIDESNNDSGILPIGSRTTEAPAPSITSLLSNAVVTETSIQPPNLDDFIVDVHQDATLAIAYEIFDNPWFHGTASHTGNITASTPLVTVSDDTWFVRYVPTAVYASTSTNGVEFRDPGNWKVYGGGFTDEAEIFRASGINEKDGVLNGDVANITNGFVGPNASTGLSVTGATSNVFISLKFLEARTVSWYYMFPFTKTVDNKHPTTWAIAGADNVSGETFAPIDAAAGSIDGSQPYNKYKREAPSADANMVFAISDSDIEIGEIVRLWKS